MALQATCPECGATETLPDDFTARTVECGQCRNIFPAPRATASEPTAQTARPATPTMAVPTPPPPPSIPPRPPATPNANATKPVAGFDLVEDDEAVHSSDQGADTEDRPAPRSRRDRDRDERDEHDERPRRERRRPAIPISKGSPITVAILTVMALVIGGGSAGSAAFLMLPKVDDPNEITEEQKRATARAMGDFIDENGQIVKKDPPKDDNNVIKAIPIPNDPLTVYPTQLDKNYVTIQFSSLMTDTCIGADGRLLFVLLSAEQQVVAIDLCTGKTAIRIPVSPNARIAAGATKLFIADSITRKVERWDLRTMEKDLEKAALPGDGTVLAMAMGSASDYPLIVSNGQTMGKPALTFVDGQTLNETNLNIEGDVIDGLSNLVWLRVTPNGSRWLASPRTIPVGKVNNVPRNKSAIYIRKGNKTTCEVNDLPVGVKALSNDGQTVYTRYGTVDPLFPTDVGAYKTGTAFQVPAVNGEMSVVLSNSVSGERAPPELGLPASVRPISLHFAYQDNQGIGYLLTSRVALPTTTTIGALPPEKSVYFVPEAQVVATIPDSSDKVVIAKVTSFMHTMRELKKDGLPIKTQIVSSPPTTYIPGTTYRYQVRTAPVWTNTKYQLAFAQPGMTINDDGLITWNVPKDFNKEELFFGVGVYLKNAAPISQTVRLYSVAEKKIDPMPMPEPKPKDPKDPMPKPKDPKDPKDPMPKPKDKSDPPLVPVDFAPGAKLVVAADQPLTLTPANFTGASITVPAPGPIASICAGGGGRYLLFFCPTALKVGVFDTATAKVTKTIATKTDNVLIAAGADKLMIVYPDTKMVERWSLVTFEKETEKKLDTRQTIIAAAMGNATQGPLVLGGPKAQDNASKMGLMFIDLPTLKEVKIEKAEGKFGVSFGSAAFLRASSNGKLLSAWSKDLSPTGAQLVALEDNTLTGTYFGEDAGQVIPFANGSAVGTGKGKFLPNSQKEGQPNDIILPGVQSLGYLHVTPPEGNGRRVITVKDATNQTLATFNNLPQYDGKRDPFERDVHPLTLDQRLTYVPDAKIIVVIPPSGNKLHVFKVPPPK